MLLKEKTDKKSLREFILNERKILGKIGAVEKFSKAITKKILLSNDYKNAKHIALYYPIKNEIDITGIIYQDKSFYFPKCIKEKMVFCKVKNLNELKKGAFNIPEPQNEEIDPEILDVIYIPALCANQNKYRLGYGKGFYDRFFKNNNITAKKIIVVPKRFILNYFIEDDFDVPCDEILSETLLNIC